MLVVQYMQHKCLQWELCIAAGRQDTPHDSRTQCCTSGMDDAGLLHLATRMPQLLHVDVTGCDRITPGGLSTAREAAAGGTSHRMVIERDSSESGGTDWDMEPDELEDHLNEFGFDWNMEPGGLDSDSSEGSDDG